MSDDSDSGESRKDPGLSYLRGLTFGPGAYLFDDADPVATTMGVMQNESGSASNSVSSGDAGAGIIGLIIAMPFIFIFGSPFFEAYFVTKLLPGLLEYFRIPQFFGTNNILMGIDFDPSSNRYVFTSAKYYNYYVPALLFTLGLSLIRYIRGFYIFFISLVIFAATYGSDDWFGWFIFGMLVFRFLAIFLLSRRQSIRYKYKVVKIFAPVISEIAVGFGMFIVFMIASITALHYFQEYKSHLYDGQISERGPVVANQDGFMYESSSFEADKGPIARFHKGDHLNVSYAVLGDGEGGYVSFRLKTGNRDKIVYARNLPGLFLPVKDKSHDYDRDEESKRMTIWKRAMEDREPVQSVRQLYRSVSSPLLIDEQDATRAFNIIIQKKSGLFSDNELAQINAGLHIQEMNERFKRYEKYKMYKSRDERTNFHRSFIDVFNYAFLFSPNYEATEQLWNNFKQYVDYPGFQEKMPYEAKVISGFLNSSTKLNIHCPAFDKGPFGYIQRILIGLWRIIDFITGREGS